MNAATAIILDALDDISIEPPTTKRYAQQLAHELVEALEVRGYALRKKPAPHKPTAPVEVFEPDTGNAALDAFMRTHHRPDWPTWLKRAKARNRPGMKNMPAPAPGYPRRRMTENERVQLWLDHNVIQHS